MNHVMVIPVGDFSGDGHDKVVNFYYMCNKTVDQVRDAYFAAKEKYPEVCPSEYCSEYEDHAIPPETLKILKNLSAPIPDDPEWVMSGDMASLTIWFCQLGDPELQFEETELPSLFFCGKDSKGRYSDNVGYGCFS